MGTGTCSALMTSMITPPLSICARPDFTSNDAIIGLVLSVPGLSMMGVPLCLRYLPICKGQYLLMWSSSVILDRMSHRILDFSANFENRYFFSSSDECKTHHRITPTHIYPHFPKENAHLHL